jgi:hypothetical protein
MTFLCLKSQLYWPYIHLCMVETVGRALPCFRHGTDYILNLNDQVLRRIMRNIVLLVHQVEFRILVLPVLAAYKSIHGCWITPHTARHCPIAIKSDLGFTDQAGFSLVCCHTRRLITNRTHVQRHRHLSFYECSRHISISLTPQPIDRL